MPLSSLVDFSHPDNLHWLAILGGSILVSVATSVVPNFVESTLDLRSHNRARLVNETAARLHIAYFVFLLALLTSDDVDKGSSGFTWLISILCVLALIFVTSIVLSGKTMNRIRKYKNRRGQPHTCNLIEGVCNDPLDWWLYSKVVFHNLAIALIVGIFCAGIAASPMIIKHETQVTHEKSILPNQRKTYLTLFQKAYREVALQTKERFQTSVLGQSEWNKDEKLNVSYWINNEGALFLLGATEEHPTLWTFPLDKTSIIGCGFAHQNHSVQWEDKVDKVLILPFNEETSREVPECKYATEEQRKLKSIVCATYNANEPPERTVGICIFTESDRKITLNNYQSFLKSEVESFYEMLSPGLEKSPGGTGEKSSPTLTAR